MTFTSNIPSQGQTLGQTRDAIQDNFTNYNNTISQDHIPPNSPVPFSAGQGKHNQLTMPAYLANPTTGLPPVSTATESKYYAFSITTPLGLMQFARTWDAITAAAAVPTPVSALQSPTAPITLTPNATSNVLDFTGISTVALATLYISVISNSIQFVEISELTWTPAKAFSFSSTNNGSLVSANASGNILQVKNFSGVFTASNIFWTLKFHRIQ